MTVLLAAMTAGAAVGVLLALPAPGRLRLADVTAAARAPASGRPAVPLPLAVVGLVTVLVAAVAGPVAAVLTLVAGPGLLRVRARRRQATTATRERAGALHACGVISAELAAGRTPAEALDAAAEVACGPVQVALRAAGSAARLGGDVPEALAVPADRSAAPGVLRALAACWAVCAQSGGGLSAAVLRLEEGLRAEAAQRRRVEAELAGPRATAALLAVLPGGGLLLAAGVGADPLHVLLETPIGLVCLALGLGLDGLGLLWTDRLVRRVRPP